MFLNSEVKCHGKLINNFSPKLLESGHRTRSVSSSQLSFGEDEPKLSVARSASGCATPIHTRTVREYDQQIAELQKENFSLKLRIFFLEEQMKKKGLAQDGDEAHKQNVDLKVEIENLKQELDDKQQLLKKASDAMTCMIFHHQEQFAEARSEANQLEELLTNVKLRLMDAEEKLDTTQQQLADSELKVNELLTAKENLWSSLKRSEEAEAELNRQIEEARRYAENLCVDLTRLESEIKEKDSEILHLKHDIRKNQMEIGRLKSDREKTNCSLQTRIAELDNKLQQLHRAETRMSGRASKHAVAAMGERIHNLELVLQNVSQWKDVSSEARDDEFYQQLKVLLTNHVAKLEAANKTPASLQVIHGCLVAGATGVLKPCTDDAVEQPLSSQPFAISDASNSRYGPELRKTCLMEHETFLNEEKSAYCCSESAIADLRVVDDAANGSEVISDSSLLQSCSVFLNFDSSRTSDGMSDTEIPQPTAVNNCSTYDDDQMETVERCPVVNCCRDCKNVTSRLTDVDDSDEARLLRTTDFSHPPSLEKRQIVITEDSNYGSCRRDMDNSSSGFVGLVGSEHADDVSTSSVENSDDFADRRDAADADVATTSTSHLTLPAIKIVKREVKVESFRRHSSPELKRVIIELSSAACDETAKREMETLKLEISKLRRQLEFHSQYLPRCTAREVRLNPAVKSTVDCCVQTLSSDFLHSINCESLMCDRDETLQMVATASMDAPRVLTQDETLQMVATASMDAPRVLTQDHAELGVNCLPSLKLDLSVLATDRSSAATSCEAAGAAMGHPCSSNRCLRDDATLDRPVQQKNSLHTFSCRTKSAAVFHQLQMLIGRNQQTADSLLRELADFGNTAAADKCNRINEFYDDCCKLNQEWFEFESVCHNLLSDNGSSPVSSRFDDDSLESKNKEQSEADERIPRRRSRVVEITEQPAVAQNFCSQPRFPQSDLKRSLSQSTAENADKKWEPSEGNCAAETVRLRLAAAVELNSAMSKGLEICARLHSIIADDLCLFHTDRRAVQLPDTVYSSDVDLTRNHRVGVAFSIDSIGDNRDCATQEEMKDERDDDDDLLSQKLFPAERAITLPITRRVKELMELTPICKEQLCQTQRLVMDAVVKMSAGEGNDDLNHSMKVMSAFMICSQDSYSVFRSIIKMCHNTVSDMQVLCADVARSLQNLDLIGSKIISMKQMLNRMDVQLLQSFWPIDVPASCASIHSHLGSVIHENKLLRDQLSSLSLRYRRAKQAMKSAEQRLNSNSRRKQQILAAHAAL